MTRLALLILLAATVLAAAPVGALAQDFASYNNVRIPAQGPLARAGRGIGNILISPLEIPATMRRVAFEKDPFFGIWAGGLEGVGNGVSRMLAGVVEFCTAPIPGFTLPLYSKELGQRATPPDRLPTGCTKP